MASGSSILLTHTWRTTIAFHRTRYAPGDGATKSSCTPTPYLHARANMSAHCSGQLHIPCWTCRAQLHSCAAAHGMPTGAACLCLQQLLAACWQFSAVLLARNSVLCCLLALLALLHLLRSRPNPATTSCVSSAPRLLEHGV